MIHDEWIRNVLKQWPDLKPEDLSRTRSLMNTHVQGSLVTNFEHLLPSVELLPDNDDRHGRSHSQRNQFNRDINLTDFPPEQIKRYNLVAQHPDDFIFDLLDLHPANVCEAAGNYRRSLKNPTKTVDEYLDMLLKQGLTQNVGLLREWNVVL